MPDDIRIALIGLDSSHSVEFARRMQAPDCPQDHRVHGMRAVTCLRFETPFQDQQGLDDRQAQLESWGIEVTESFEDAVADCDALFVEINDAAYHLEYFTKVAELGKPFFLDKPLADTIDNGRKICSIAAARNVGFFSASSLRFVPALTAACETVPEPQCCTVYGPLGQAPAGSSIVWYGVHSFEMLQRAMGTGAQTLQTRQDESGVVVVVDYANGARGVVELTVGAYVYGGCLRTSNTSAPFVVDMGSAYTDLLVEIGTFLAGGEAPMDMAETLEIMAMLDAAERSLLSGAVETV
jgi:predicted dehydrogenase